MIEAFAWGIEKTHKTSVGIFSVLAKILTMHLPNMRLKHYLYTSALCTGLMILSLALN
jgi:hypothetical protein